MTILLSHSMKISRLLWNWGPPSSKLYFHWFYRTFLLLQDSQTDNVLQTQALNIFPLVTLSHAFALITMYISICFHYQMQLRIELRISVFTVKWNHIKITQLKKSLLFNFQEAKIPMILNDMILGLEKDKRDLRPVNFNWWNCFYSCL